MATHVLSADTLISSLMPSGGGSLASGDTIDFSGHGLILDANALAYPFTPANVGGEKCNLEFRQGGAAKINASLPATVHPYVDPEHPLAESDYEAGLTGNASAELQFGDFSLGGGQASLPTETRAGAFWAIVVSSPSTTELVFDRDIPLHAGDRMFSVSLFGNDGSASVATVSAYDTETQKATFAATPPTRTIGSVYVLCSGGICFNTACSNKTIFSSPLSGGTIILHLSSSNANIINQYGLSAERFAVSGNRFAGGGGDSHAGFFGPVKVGQLAISGLGRGGNSAISPSLLPCGVVAGEAAMYGLIWSVNKLYNGEVKIGGGIVAKTANVAMRSGVGMEFRNTIFGASIGIPTPGCVHLDNCTIQGVPTGDMYLQNGGTAIRTARTSFPVDTDLPDAWAHTPNAAAAVTWRYEDRWVRKGETLRIRARWMPAGASSRASVAITELATWWPDLWPIGAEALAKTEFAAGLEQLKWHDGAVEWRNDTGEDCQVRVWECVSGDTLGGYLRVWEATGGAM